MDSRFPPQPAMSTPNPPARSTPRNEAVLFFALLAFGALVLPALIYLVGNAIFGEYGGSGVGAFYGALRDNLLGGNLAAWFVILSPYLIWQLLRLTFAAFHAGRH